MTSETPDVLIVGHITRDLLPDGGWRPGGAALYAAHTASLRGLRVAIATSATADVVAAALALLPGVALHVAFTTISTTFENIYTEGGRRQYLRAHALPVRMDEIPQAWRAAPIVLLAPVADDVVGEVPTGSQVTGLAPQGWLRTWDANGLVRPRALTARHQRALAQFDVVFVSREDMAGSLATSRQRAQTEAKLRALAQQTQRLVVTCGRDGAELRRNQPDSVIMRSPGFPAHEVDPTGAGDVFAMTFLCALAASGSEALAMVEANQVAALSVEGAGLSAIPTPDVARARFSYRGD